MITEVTDRDDLDLSEPGLTVVEFYRNGCKYCQMLAPVIKDVAGQLEDVHFQLVNCSFVEGMAREFDLSGFPTLKVFKDGDEVDSITGFIRGDILARRLEAKQA